MKLDPDHEGITVLRNVSRYSSNDKASHPARLESSSITLLIKLATSPYLNQSPPSRPTTSYKASHAVSSFRLFPPQSCRDSHNPRAFHVPQLSQSSSLILLTILGLDCAYTSLQSHYLICLILITTSAHYARCTHTDTHTHTHTNTHTHIHTHSDRVSSMPI